VGRLGRAHPLKVVKKELPGGNRIKSIWTKKKKKKHGGVGNKAVPKILSFL